MDPDPPPPAATPESAATPRPTSAELAAILEAAPFNRLLGLRLLNRDDRVAEVGLAPREELLQEEGRVHGGLLSSLMDTTAVYLAWPQRPAGTSMTSIEFKLNFLRPAQLAGGEILARATPVKLGRMVAVVDVEAHQDGLLLAKGLFTYAFPAPG